MRAVESSGPAQIDLSSFITYDNDQDRTPTDAELVEELPDYEMPPAMKALAEGKPIEKPLRRGKGYLRAEIDTVAGEATDSQDADADADFGAGVEFDRADAPTETRTNEITDIGSSGSSVDALSETDSAASEVQSPGDSDGETSARPKKRRRRRRGKRRGGSGNAESGSQPAATDGGQASADSGGDGQTVPAAESSSSEESGQRKPRRNRRRRRRRRGSGGGGEGGGSDSAPQPSAD